MDTHYSERSSAQRAQIMPHEVHDTVTWRSDFASPRKSLADNTPWPLDIQVLPGNRLLLVEYYQNRVAERNLQGELLFCEAGNGLRMREAETLSRAHPSGSDSWLFRKTSGLCSASGSWPNALQPRMLASHIGAYRSDPYFHPSLWPRGHDTL